MVVHFAPDRFVERNNYKKYGFSIKTNGCGSLAATASASRGARRTGLASTEAVRGPLAEPRAIQ